MAKANEGTNGSGVEPTEQPYNADKGESIRTSWVTGEIDKEERKWAMFCHLAELAGLSPLLSAVQSRRWLYGS